MKKLPTSSTWLPAMVGLVEVGWLLDESDLAAEAAELLRPFADLPVMASLAVTCFGSASRALGRAALVADDPVSAVACFERAVAGNLRLGHRPAAMLSRAELAEALVARGTPDDLARARTSLAEAVDEARALGLPRRVSMWAAAAAALEPSTAVLCRRPGREGWTVRCGSTRVDLPNLVGLHYLSQLLTHPGREVAAVDLGGTAMVEGRQELLDSAAVTAYRGRLRDLANAIESNIDNARAERLRQEREAIATELAQAVGLGGRLREFPTAPERARTAVRKAIKRAVDAITAVDPVLGGELRADVSTGTICRYTPTGRPWRVEHT